MTREQLWKRYSSLPIAVRRGVAQMISILADATNGGAKSLQPQRRKSLSEEPAVGMWQDRNDMEDSVEWVRKLRRREWTRNRC